MADSTLSVNLNLTPAAFSAAWSEYLVTKVTTGPYTVATHAATRHLGPTQNFVENCLLQFQEKTAKTILNVREYGALGDGATDDAEAIQDAIDAANALGGASIYLGAGNFIVGSQLTIYEGTHIIGAGHNDTVLEYGGAGYAIVQNTPETQIYGVRLEGFSITFDDGGLDLNSISESLFSDLHLLANSAGVGTCARIQSTASNQGFDNTFVACHFQNGAIGLQLGTGGTNRNKVVACIVEDCTTGILITDGASNLIQGCTILDNTTGIQINESAGVLSQGNHIDACLFDEQVTRNININTAGIDYTRVTNNFFVTAPNADINNGVNTFASGNLPLAAPWGVLYSDVAEIDYLGAATFSGGISFAGDLLPDADSTYDLGAVGTEWAEAHIDSLYVTGVTTVGGSILTDTDSADDIGSNAARFANLWVDDVNVTNSLETGGIITAQSGIVSGANIEADGHLLLTVDGGYSIGSDLVRWANLWVDDVNVTNSLETGGIITAQSGIVSGSDIEADGNLLLTVDGGYSIGSNLVRWANLWVDAITCTGAVSMDGHLTLTTDSAYNLGTNAVRWANAYVDAVTVTNTITTGGTITSGGNIVSDTDSTDTLGTNAVRWATTYTDSAIVTDQVKVNSTSGSAQSTSDDLVVGTASAGAEYYGITLFAGLTGGSRITFGNSSSNNEADITYYPSLDYMQFTSNSTAAMLLYSTKLSIRTSTPTIEMGNSGPTISRGTGSPEGVVTAGVGSLWMRTDGGAGTTLYVKESGAGNTGWVAK